jgi:CP family cyanate transporter-like MFS transporter
MAQSVGYLLAASGPPLVGLLRDLSKGWDVPLALCLALTLVIAGSARWRGATFALPDEDRPG